MNGKIEGVIVPGKFPLPEFGGQLALLVDAWVREWRACIGNVELTAGGVSLGQVLYFRADTWEQLAADDAYQPHLRIQNHDELMGAPLGRSRRRAWWRLTIHKTSPALRWMRS
jgi:hypothetical protein